MATFGDRAQKAPLLAVCEASKGIWSMSFGYDSLGSRRVRSSRISFVSEAIQYPLIFFFPGSVASFVTYSIKKQAVYLHEGAG